MIFETFPSVKYPLPRDIFGNFSFYNIGFMESVNLKGLKILNVQILFFKRYILVFNDIM